MLEQLFSYFTEENLTDFFQSYRAFGPFAAILLPFIEALLPFLPLIVFVIANVNSFGLWQGFIFTWIGASAGSIAVFLFIRHFGQQKALGFIRRHQSVKKLMIWVEKRGFGPLFLLLCFPFTPSAAVNVVAGLSRISLLPFTLAVLCGKFVMIFIVSFIGHDLMALFTQPLRTAGVTIVILILWYAGKRVEHRLNVKFSQREND
ncbi:TVP38/TMEM64 family protein [Bacillus swezeyi]|uniref:TVP38/TMEM64 family membrane protein n=1 Tax=Bacillus swezeyi TaxID=1925020 RepID=A0A1R1RWA5_9BACI|nr:TVP38/TMEM64 family protein [Bacillus swezeyi]MEC1261649.1 TVP38/TMEM64 family protein [Bacillus swezeyi]MED2926488.1 TVP38/TMEM64 family protein [Bacillus swezeyi]MED2943957.1 TVP38/TMEM64 family protein [Bacillus swezeyi]MED2965949.1 TVP38/TMEM64 family protein [Bacillus swezeyi]MED2978573.1 TVP38/TMEM64 family protein [Bacillus swezeyi]